MPPSLRSRGPRRTMNRGVDGGIFPYPAAAGWGRMMSAKVLAEAIPGPL
ncbi:hypothetical protein [Arthrobacter sp. SAFR-044]